MFVEEYLLDLRRARYRPSAWAAYVYRCLVLSREHAFQRPRAVRSLALVGLSGFLFLLAGSVALALRYTGHLALLFFQGTGFALLLGLVWMLSHIKLLEDGEGRPLPRINAANILTLARLVTVPALFIFLGHHHHRLALTAYLAGAATDVADGWVARLFHQKTGMGRVFDPLVDIIYNAGAILALNREGYIPLLVLALVLTRYGILLLGGAAIYIFRGPLEIKPTVLGKTTGVVTTLLVFTLVAGALAMPGPRYREIAELLVVALGFVEGITIPQVIMIGWYNYKLAGQRSRALLRLVPVDRNLRPGGS